MYYNKEVHTTQVVLNSLFVNVVPKKNLWQETEWFFCAEKLTFPGWKWSLLLLTAEFETEAFHSWASGHSVWKPLMALVMSTIKSERLSTLSTVCKQVKSDSMSALCFICLSIGNTCWKTGNLYGKKNVVQCLGNVQSYLGQFEITSMKTGVTLPFVPFFLSVIEQYNLSELRK